MRKLLIFSLGFILLITDSAWARRHRSYRENTPTSKEILEDWVLEGSEEDAIVEPGFKMGSEKDAIIRDKIIDGGDAMAEFENELPEGAIRMAPGDKIAAKDERPGIRVVPGPDKCVPGGTMPGEYDATKETNKWMWRLIAFLKKGGKKFRFLGDKVFEAKVKEVRHKEPRWIWGRYTTEKVTHVRKWTKKLVTTKIIKKCIKKKLKKLLVGHRIVKKLKVTDESPTPVMTPVRCPVYQRTLVPVYQRYRIPVYKWVPVTVGKYEQTSFLTWIKRYRRVKGTYAVWSYWGTFDEFVKKYPAMKKKAELARKVTERVLEERRILMSRLKEPDAESFLRKTKPKENPKAEFYLAEKKKSLWKKLEYFVENNVPETELVTIPRP